MKKMLTCTQIWGDNKTYIISSSSFTFWLSPLAFSSAGEVTIVKNVKYEKEFHLFMQLE